MNGARIVVLLGCLVLAGSPLAQADDVVADAQGTIIAAPGSAFAGFAKADATITAGNAATFDNLSPIPHNIRSFETKPCDPNFPDGPQCPLFRIDTFAGPQQDAVVTGTEDLAPGMYRFYCEPHSRPMTGTLTVVAPAPPAAA